MVGGLDGAFPPIRVDSKLYLKDDINDTIYTLENSSLRPAYVFDLGKYTIPIKYLQIVDFKDPDPVNAFRFINFVGTPKYFFYNLRIPKSFSKPKEKEIINIEERIVSREGILGMYNIEKKTNILLDIDANFQKGIVNDMNGGFPVIPQSYAGNGVIIDIWKADEMKETLTNEYFTSQTIKDQVGHQKLKELLKNLKEEDNPVVVIATLKDR
jgi:hypothetical protein